MRFLHTSRALTAHEIAAFAWHVTQALRHPCYVVEALDPERRWGYVALPMPVVDETDVEVVQRVVAYIEKEAAVLAKQNAAKAPTP